MKILSIETSCDETAVSLVEAERGLESPSFKVLGNALFSQIAIHKEYGGVYPMLAKREHARNLTPLLEKVLKESNLISNSQFLISKEKTEEIRKILEREDGLFESFVDFLLKIQKPDVDVIAVTSGPGLEPALWVGISFAEALSKLWGVPVIGVNHMEGHIASVMIESKDEREVTFPAIAVLISGGHTEIVKIEDWGKYTILGSTVDDAVGEAFDKTARLLGLPYPGGPEISKLAQIARDENIPKKAKLPRPMLHSHNLNFSFSGLKTAVLYYIKDNFNGDSTTMTEDEKMDLAREFEDSVIEVLMEKTKEALEEHEAKTLIVAGGVIANKKLREYFTDFEKKYTNLVVKVPERELATDNSLMIASAAYINLSLYPKITKLPKKIIAKGNLILHS